MSSTSWSCGGATRPVLHATARWRGTHLLAAGSGHSGAAEDTLAEDPAFILATSGTTAKPKLAVHSHGGYGVHIAAMGDWVFGLRAGETWWSTSDIGWVVGHSYIVYAPLMAGATTIAYEGALDHPDADAPWSIIEREGGHRRLHLADRVRLLMRYGEAVPRRHDLGRLERRVLRRRGAQRAGLGVAPADRVRGPRAGHRPHVADRDGRADLRQPVRLRAAPDQARLGRRRAARRRGGRRRRTTASPSRWGRRGSCASSGPFPGLIATLWGEPERYVADYWEQIPGGYYVGDAAHIDEDGYVWFAGRADEIIKIAGHRLGTIEVETAFLRHPAVAEAGVTGVPDELRGEVIDAFVALKAGHEPSDELRRELLQTVRRELGPVAVIGHLSFVAMLPKTRSGKIMRRVLKAVALDRDPGDISTIEDEGSVDEARRAVEEMRAGIVT